MSLSSCKRWAKMFPDYIDRLFVGDMVKIFNLSNNVVFTLTTQGMPIGYRHSGEKERDYEISNFTIYEIDMSIQ